MNTLWENCKYHNTIYRKYRRNWVEHIDRIPEGTVKYQSLVGKSKFGKTFEMAEGFYFVMSFTGLSRHNTTKDKDSDDK
jgi:hypothetical protein